MDKPMALALVAHDRSSSEETRALIRTLEAVKEKKACEGLEKGQKEVTLLHQPRRLRTAPHIFQSRLFPTRPADRYETSID
jgi:hypothetical protein